MTRPYVQITRLITVWVGTSVAIFTSGCASNSNSDGRGSNQVAFGSEPEGIWEESQASPHAFDSFTFRKMQPIGAKNSFQFYYKTCEESGPRTWYSKTAYECTVP